MKHHKFSKRGREQVRNITNYELHILDRPKNRTFRKCHIHVVRLLCKGQIKQIPTHQVQTLTLATLQNRILHLYYAFHWFLNCSQNEVELFQKSEDIIRSRSEIFKKFDEVIEVIK